MIIQLFDHDVEIDAKLFDFMNNDVIKNNSKVLRDFLKKRKTIAKLEVMFKRTQNDDECYEIVDIINATYDYRNKNRMT